jgi:fermentation-respiration switch protein FrsA (DUF1100 family)
LSETEGRRVRWRAVSGALALVVVVPYAAIVGWIKSSESELVFRASMSRGAAGLRQERPSFVSEVSIALPSGATLKGLAFEAAPERSRGRWILHLHGNADTAFSEGQVRHAIALRDRGFGVLAFDYRGFGASAGVPSEASIHEDSEAALRWLIAQGVPVGKIIVWGHSLGSGPAVELAARHPIAGLVTFGAFTSVPDRGAELFPWLPVHWIATIQFDNRRRISEVQVPVVIVHGATDRTIPVTHAQGLFGAANEPKRLLILRAISEDGFGGHYSAAYEQLDRVLATMEGVMRVGRR